MHIQLSEAGKKFNREWIFRDINFPFNRAKLMPLQVLMEAAKALCYKLLQAA